jgi:hypothetical protein
MGNILMSSSLRGPKAFPISWEGSAGSAAVLVVVLV